jgi:hypothetical protein
MTQITINVAKDDEALQLLSEANFWQLHIGIETPRRASLMEVNKFQNAKGDMVEDVLRMAHFGIMVKALMMVGFDHDDQTIFDELCRAVSRHRRRRDLDAADRAAAEGRARDRHGPLCRDGGHLRRFQRNPQAHDARGAV